MFILKIYGRVLAQLAPERRLAILLVFANLALAGAQFVEPVLFGRIIDRLTTAQTHAREPTWAELTPLMAAWIGFGLFSIAAAVTVALHADRLSHRRRLAVMASFFDHLLELPLSFHGGTHSGRLLKIMLDGAGGMAGIWLSFFRENCASITALFVLLPATVFVNWRLGLVLVVLVAFFGLLTVFVLRRTHGLQARVELFNAELAERASDALGNVPVIQSFTRIENESRGVRRIIDQVLAAQLPVLSWWALAAVATRASATLSLLAIFIIGVWLHLHHLATIGVIVTFMNFATILVARLEQVVNFFNFLLMQAPKIASFFEVMDTAPSVADRPGAIDPGRLAGQVVFDHVTFAYDDKRKAVDDVSFAVKPGETVALVGATGSGKSTTLSLLHRAFDPQDGAIRIDGIDIRDMKLCALRRNIGVVFQEPMLFARSIEENLRVGKVDATNSEIALALERAQAADFVSRQTEGIDTLVGERGRTLSGGERQRLSIARALLKDPPIMIFDEATAALDAATEKQLQAALNAATRGRTTFVIAHRLATIRGADRIFVFDQGRIVEQGSFEDLVAQGGLFAALARAQFMAAGA
ncbi:glucan ABC transporter ATP-binding protein/ permease [Rhodoblastus acidophilus]|uniref:Glucan ABC transporter ATP-binding protein/ permease n=1 Tax=Candidatus Rhodoblastus alkanivorans TaxID=2954117 RepID=A0ABS9Z147_9HYPH|nr:glucan ABC transporter ATP-binding protein/ permease [Candidatus Rhodoblastus alkanivorans]MCI4678541.1 glucan ABC transporter ATP-binding protein/ permease [Candidatus Rhodoblastus alkanivorans]MCI4681371.1 glucan ABC transporter ATP-binding protein/ permease [Candidatus Rhodoblastus alkanivorans]MDI4642419.1 glucan ABC transporter ATP-binding protein/ permease [Rhodoblastus acidophilus]